MTSVVMALKSFCFHNIIASDRGELRGPRRYAAFSKSCLKLHSWNPSQSLPAAEERLWRSIGSNDMGYQDCFLPSVDFRRKPHTATAPEKARRKLAGSGVLVGFWPPGPPFPAKPVVLAAVPPGM